MIGQVPGNMTKPVDLASNAVAQVRPVVAQVHPLAANVLFFVKKEVVVPLDAAFGRHAEPDINKIEKEFQSIICLEDGLLKNIKNGYYPKSAMSERQYEYEEAITTLIGSVKDFDYDSQQNFYVHHEEDACKLIVGYRRFLFESALREYEDGQAKENPLKDRRVLRALQAGVATPEEINKLVGGFLWAKEG